MPKKQKVWETENYYQQAKEASLTLDHPGLNHIKQHIQADQKVLEVGCGEGTKLHQITNGKAKGFGIDISKKAIQMGKKQYPEIDFKQGDAENLPYDDNTFDVVFSAFMLEHVQEPEKVIEEMIRILKKGGMLFIITPNFGAPFRRSPCFKGNRIKRAYIRVNKDLWHYLGIKQQKTLGWLKVDPKASEKEYQIDWDTTVEPYMVTLISFLRHRGVVIKEKTTCWSIPEENERITNKIFRFLGQQDLYPFIYWGPHIFLEAEKKDVEVGQLTSIIDTTIHWLKITTFLILFILPGTPVLIALWIIVQRLIHYIVRQLRHIKNGIH